MIMSFPKNMTYQQSPAYFDDVQLWRKKNGSTKRWVDRDLDLSYRRKLVMIATGMINN